MNFAEGLMVDAHAVIVKLQACSELHARGHVTKSPHVMGAALLKLIGATLKLDGHARILFTY